MSREHRLFGISQQGLAYLRNRYENTGKEICVIIRPSPEFSYRQYNERGDGFWHTTAQVLRLTIKHLFLVPELAQDLDQVARQ